MRVLLHACCGPCLLEPYDFLAAMEGHDVEVVYANPNIHPVGEYERRRDVLLSHAREAGIPVREAAYDPAEWMHAVAGVEGDQSSRCRACFGLRMRMAAAAAASGGFDAIATTLTVSPYQDLDAIREAGEEAASEVGIAYLHHDLTGRYREATRRSRELGMYRQKYCGCLLSEIEARRR